MNGEADETSTWTPSSRPRRRRCDPQTPELRVGFDAVEGAGGTIRCPQSAATNSASSMRRPLLRGHDGNMFPRDPEPRAEHLDELAALVRSIPGPIWDWPSTRTSTGSR